MNQADQQPNTGASGESLRLPPPGQEVMVRCPGFRCLAYRDKDGMWRDVAHDEALAEVLEVLWEP